MTRNLKVLGLALVAVFAMTAMSASAALAQGELTSEGGVAFTLAGEDQAAGNALTYPGEEPLTCPGSTYVGEAIGGGLLESGASELTVTPTYVNCTAGGFPATVEMNSCDYEFTIGGEEAANEFALTADLACSEEGDEVEVNVYLGSNHNTRLCQITFGEQTGLTGGTAVDNGNGTGSVEGSFDNISASKSGLCGAGETNEAEYDVAVDLVGLDSESNPVGIEID